MATVLIIEVDATLDQYDQIRDAVEVRLGDGQIAHYAGAVDGKLTVVDLWESRAHFDRFVEEHLGAALQSAGAGQPRITEFEAHSVETR